MNEDKFKKIDDLNDTLENVNTLVSNTFSSLSDLDGVTQEVAQAIVDDICIRISNEISHKLDDKRNDIINVLHEGYVASNEIISTLQPFIDVIKNGIPDLSGVINILIKFFKVYTKPYAIAVEYVTVLTPKLLTLSDNISKLALLKNQIPQPPNIPVVNFNKLSISMKPITINDVISGV